MNKAHKIAEREQLERFRDAWSHRSAISSIDDGDHDGPDVEGVLATGRRFGLEIVGFKDPVQAERETFLHDRLHPDLERAAGPHGTQMNFCLMVEDRGFDRLGSRRERRKLVDRLLAFAIASKGTHGIVHTAADLESQGFDGLSSVAVLPSNAVHLSIGQTTQDRGWTSVQKRIAEKDAKIGAYREKLGPMAEQWLLIVAGTSLADTTTRA
jgi:hypothetical protein